MKFKWLNKKENNKKLIVFFNGWGMNETPIKHLEYGSFDVLMIFDYRYFKLNFDDFNFSKYLEKYLICWSMGVYVANLFKEKFEDFNKKIAINGTNNIISDKFGIPEKIYEATLEFLSKETIDKFVKNMFNKSNLNPEITISKTVEELKEELISIQNLKLNNEIKYDKVVISKADRIIPTKNQINFWKNKANYEIIDSTHYPFNMYLCWQDILC